MLENNLATASNLIHNLLEIVPIASLSDAVVFGSAAIVLNRIELNRPIHDLDLFISGAACQSLRQQPGLIEREKYGVHFLAAGDDERIELWPSFLGVDFDGIKDHARPLQGSCGLLVASLADLRIWKKAQGRPKDIKDLHCMEA